MHFQDLSRCDYFRANDALVSIGWLERGQDYQRGEVSEEFSNKLQSLLVRPFQPSMKMGWHTCDLCHKIEDGPLFVTFQGKSVKMGISNLFVPAVDKVFVSPSLIVHYILEHNYKPPDVFIEAVRSCPEMLSLEYFRQLVASGMKVDPGHLETIYGLRLDS